MQEKPHNTATLKQFIADHIRRWTVFLFYLQSYLIVLGFLYFGYIITFFSTGIPGIKLTNMLVPKYFLDSAHLEFFLGRSKLSSN